MQSAASQSSTLTFHIDFAIRWQKIVRMIEKANETICLQQPRGTKCDFLSMNLIRFIILAGFFCVYVAVMFFHLNGTNLEQKAPVNRIVIHELLDN